MKKRSGIKTLVAVPVAILITAALFFCLLIPIQYAVSDGGSYGYEAKLYAVHVHNPGKDLYPDEERYVSVHIFPFIDLHIPID